MLFLRGSLSAILLLALSTGSRGEAANHTTRHSRCERLLARVGRAELEPLVVGRKITFAQAEGVCPGSNWLATPWSIEFDADGTAVRGFHRIPRVAGRYFTRSSGPGQDRLCIASIAPIGIWEGPDRPTSVNYSAWTDCFALYRDPQGRLYLQGDSLPDSGPIMVRLQPIPSAN